MHLPDGLDLDLGPGRPKARNSSPNAFILQNAEGGVTPRRQLLGERQ